MKLDRNEVARYLGWQRKPLPQEVCALIDACEAELLAQTEPRHLGRRFSLAELAFVSADLKRHLRDAQDAWLIAITLGSEADRLLRIWSVENMAKAAVGQACTAVLLDRSQEDYLLELKEQSRPGEHLLPAFSPGYGDFPLADQEKLLRLLDARRRLGVFLTSGGMLMPEKSVTAVVGITRQAAASCPVRCLGCGKRDCLFRKEYE